MISVSTPAVASDLLTLFDFPDSIRGTNNVNDPRLSLLITRVSSAIPRYCGRVFAQATYQEDIAGHGSNLLRLMQTPLPDGQFAGLYPGGPVTSITSIVKLDSENSTASTTINSSDYQIHNAMSGLVFRRQGWEWTAQLLTDLDSYPVHDSERPLFRAIYQAGYTTPRFGTSSTIVEGTLPYDIRQAAINAVVSWFHEEQRDPSVTRRRMGATDVEIQYGGTGQASFGLPYSVREMLAPWARWD